MSGTCGAKSKTTGKPCGQPLGHRTNHPGVGKCWIHGGASPRAQLAGVVELARREMAVMGSPIAIAPHAAILECIQIAAGEVRYASEAILELQEGDTVGAVLTYKKRPRKQEQGAEGGKDDEATETMIGEPALNIWFKLRHEAMDRLVTYSATALRAGVEAAQVEIAKGQAEILADVLRAFAVRMGLDPADPIVRTGMREGLQLARGTA